MELSSGIRKLLSGVKINKSTPFNLNSMPYHCYQDVSNLQCYQNDFSKLEELTRVLANMDAINGKLVDTISNSTIFDEQIKHDMCTFKSLARAFIGSPPVQHKMKHVLVSTMGTQNEPFSPFSQAREREPIVIDNLAKVSNFLDVSTQQRKVVRFKVCPQATQHRILIGTLKEVLNNFKVDLDALDSQGLDKDTIMGQQIVLTCLKFLTEAAVSNEPESNSWMRLSPSNNVNTSGSRKWEDVLEMFNDLIKYFRAETRLKLHVAKAEVMKEGLLQIKDILIDNSIGYKEARHQERLVQKKLSKTLGHSSRCLFTLLLYYLFGRVSDIEVDMAGGVYKSGSDNKNWLCLGRILTSDSEKMIGRGVKQLDKAPSLFKFVWETAEMKDDLDLEGHLWCVGEHNRMLRQLYMSIFTKLFNLYSMIFILSIAFVVTNKYSIANYLVYVPIFTEPEQGAFQVSSIPPTIKRLELLFSPDYEALYFPFMNYLLSSCCPNSISFSFRSYVHGKAFIQSVVHKKKM
ncbi:hypothetical protein Ahy_B09g095149 isoform D [Arachis hypogaea]|uniref:Uncharacterized protein n=1 Tax=Arachis hypogaea TaxID=3818 RepID=A0A444XD20_ARAHY|nr:hypothetical protein Ahy_B09g095149 isoform D [Arachis hypogaea]